MLSDVIIITFSFVCVIYNMMNGCGCTSVAMHVVVVVVVVVVVSRAVECCGGKFMVRRRVVFVATVHMESIWRCCGGVAVRSELWCRRLPLSHIRGRGVCFQRCLLNNLSRPSASLTPIPFFVPYRHYFPHIIGSHVTSLNFLIYSTPTYTHCNTPSLLITVIH